MNSVIAPAGEPNFCAACGAEWSPEYSGLFENDFVCPKCGSRQRPSETGRNVFFLKSGNVMSQIEEYLSGKEGESDGLPLILDMSDAEFFTSSELGRLLMLNRKARAARRRIVLRNVPRDIRDVLEITKIDRLFGDMDPFSDKN